VHGPDHAHDRGLHPGRPVHRRWRPGRGPRLFGYRVVDVAMDLGVGGAHRFTWHRDAVAVVAPGSAGDAPLRVRRTPRHPTMSWGGTPGPRSVSRLGEDRRVKPVEPGSIPARS